MWLGENKIDLGETFTTLVQLRLETPHKVCLSEHGISFVILT